MNISKESIDALNAVITLTVDKVDYEKKVDDVLKDYRKKVNMPGFRPGKVPAGVVKKMYGKAVLAEEVNKLVSENLHQYITENKLDLLGEPLPSEKQQLVDFDVADSFEFIFDVALSPEIDLKLTKREKLPLYSVEITEEMVKDQADALAGRYGTSKKVEEVEDKAMVKGNLNQLDEEGNIVEGGIFAEDAVISLNIIKDEDEKKKLMGAKVGEAVVFNPSVAFPNETEISYILKVTKEEAEEAKGNFKFTITEITTFQNAEINQELFDKAFGEGLIKSEEEFNARVKEDLAGNLAMETEYRFSVDAKEKLMGKVKVDFPEAFLKRWLVATNRDNDKFDAANLDNEMPAMLDDLKWQLIKNHLIKSNDIQIEETDILDYAKKSARIQFMQYGLSNVPDEHLENYAKEMIQKEDQRRQMAEGAVNEKVMAFIKEAVKIDEKEISREDFNKLFEKN